MDQKTNLPTHRTSLLRRDLSESLGKLPPQALDLEESVLGSLMLEKSAYLTVASFLIPDHFYAEAHKIIYEAICDLSKENNPIDMKTVVSQLRKNGKLELVEGAYKIAELTSKVSSAANIEYHARIIVEMAIKRNLIEIASQIHHDAYDDTTDVFELQDRIEGLMQKNRLTVGSSGAVKIGKVMDELAVNIAARTDEKESLITGIPSGYYSIDRLTQGWQNTDLIILAARPGMGKTTLALNLSRNAAVDFDMPVAIFSLEMSTEQLVMKMVSSETSIDYKVLRGQKFDELTWTRYVHTSGRLSTAPIYIDDTAGLSITDLRARCRRLKAEKNIRIVFVDYLQLMRGERGRGDNREQEISSISRGLKLIAKELGIPVIALSQLSRAVETRGGDKRPMLSDLRESGSIEQDADAVIFMYKPEYYKITVSEDGMPYAPGYTELKWAKHRNGSPGEAVLQMVGQTSKFNSIGTEERFVKIITTNTLNKEDRQPLQNPYPDDNETPF